MGFVTSDILPSAYLNVPYAVTVAYLKNKSINQGVVFQMQTILPGWLTFDASKAELYGTPQDWSHSETLLLRADDDEVYLKLLISTEPIGDLTLVTTELPRLYQDQFYVTALTWRGGVGRLMFTASTLPNGLYLHAKSGVLYGYPTVFGGRVAFTVTVTDEANHQVQRNFVLRMEAK
jgi:hypothetical protein